MEATLNYDLVDLEDDTVPIHNLVLRGGIIIMIHIHVDLLKIRMLKSINCGEEHTLSSSRTFLQYLLLMALISCLTCPIRLCTGTSLALAN